MLDHFEARHGIEGGTLIEKGLGANGAVFYRKSLPASMALGRGDRLGRRIDSCDLGTQTGQRFGYEPMSSTLRPLNGLVVAGSGLNARPSLIRSRMKLMRAGPS